ncbi:MAG: transpeptidase family protein [Rikenellaceae bacterium]|nr:transpeptidase family protein [Rikenellaceae bacterium]
MPEQKHTIKRQIRRRALWLYVFFFLAVVIIVARLVYIQQFSQSTADYAKVISNRILTTKTLKARRGDILMRDGEPLATVLPLYQVYFDFGSEALDSLERYNKLSDSLAGLLGNYFAREGYSKAHFKQILNGYHNYERIDAKGRRHYRSVALLPRWIDYQEWSQIKQFTLLNWDIGMTYKLEDSLTRIFPLGDIAKRTVGKYMNDRIKNPFGIEDVFDSILRGEDGIQSHQRFAHNFTSNVATSKVEKDRPRVDGVDIVTTLDRRIQEISDVALRKNMVANRAIWGTAIVMDVETGEILALSNLSETTPGNYAEIDDNAFKRMCPGSTFKLASLLALVEDKGWDINVRVPIKEGRVTTAAKDERVKVGPNPKAQGIRDDHAFCDTMTMKYCVAHSSNIFFANAIYQAYKDHPEQYVAFLRKLHLDRPLGLSEFGEQAPRFNDYPTDDSRESREQRQTWFYNNRLCQIAYGYENEVTAIQTATLYNAVANEGRMVAPKLIRELRQDGRTIQKFETKVLNERICSTGSLAKVQECLEEVALTGTARQFFVRDTALFRVAAKTGTAQVVGTKDFLGSMVAYFPTDAPKYTVMVAVRNNASRGAYYGAGTSGPVVRDIIYSLYTMESEWRNPIESSSVPHRPTQVKGGNTEQMREVASELDMAFTTDVRRGWSLAEVDDSTQRAEFSEVATDQNKMPRVVGMGLKDAIYLLESRGLRVGFTGHGRVTSQSVAAGTAVRRGDYVQLVLK